MADERTHKGTHSCYIVYSYGRQGLKDAKVISAFDAGLLFFMHNDHARILTIGVNPPLLSLSLKCMDHAQDKIRQHLFEVFLRPK